MNENKTTTAIRFENKEISYKTLLTNIRKTVSTQLSYIQEDNNKKLDEMRKTVDEKLQKTLETKMNEYPEFEN